MDLKLAGKKISRSFISTLLLLLVFSFIFIFPSIELTNKRSIYNIFLTGIFITSAVSLKKTSTRLLILVGILLVVHWLSDMLDLYYLELVSKSLRVLFFVLIVVLIAHQVATSRKVDAGTILESINSYLLIGIMFSVIVSIVEGIHPGSFQYQSDTSGPADFTYFTFVTMTTLGYGDITPVTSLSKSLSILISVTGQIYIAVVIAMLVGKFSSGTAGTK